MQDMSATMSNSTYSPMLSRVHSETSFGNLLPVLNRYNRDHHETRRISQEGLICYGKIKMRYFFSLAIVWIFFQHFSIVNSIYIFNACSPLHRMWTIIHAYYGISIMA